MFFSSLTKVGWIRFGLVDIICAKSFKKSQIGTSLLLAQPQHLYFSKSQGLNWGLILMLINWAKFTSVKPPTARPLLTLTRPIFPKHHDTAAPWKRNGISTGQCHYLTIPDHIWMFTKWITHCMIPYYKVTKNVLYKIETKSSLSYSLRAIWSYSAVGMPGSVTSCWPSRPNGKGVMSSVGAVRLCVVWTDTEIDQK